MPTATASVYGRDHIHTAPRTTRSCFPPRKLKSNIPLICTSRADNAFYYSIFYFRFISLLMQLHSSNASRIIFQTVISCFYWFLCVSEMETRNKMVSVAVDLLNLLVFYVHHIFLVLFIYSFNFRCCLICSYSYQFLNLLYNSLKFM